MSELENIINTAFDPRLLPNAQSEFESLRSFFKIYVDKTELIFSLAMDCNCYFISRPRRFGKTLLISTFASLFEHGLKYFDGLKLDKQYRKFWEKEQTYKVLRLDFSLCSTFSNVEEFLIAFENQLSNALIESGLSLPKKNWEQDTLVSRFDRLLNGLNNASLVLLIDEYDAPLNHCLDNEKLFSEVRDELYAFYLDVKKQSPKMRFVFMTGISKYKNLGIFSGTNHFTDLSLMSDYGTLLGYTKEEVEEYFSPFVENAAKVLNISYEDCIKKMATYYDGYCFDSNASTHVFTPWSVLNFLRYPQNGFNNYWYESGGQPSVLLNYIKKHSLCTPDAYGREQRISIRELDSSCELGEINDLALLFQAGYLSIKKAMPKDKAVVLNYPNSEVADSMAVLYAERLFGNRDPLSFLDIGANELFETQTPEDIVKTLNRLYLEIDYQNYPIHDEASVRSHLQMYLRGAEIKATVEMHNAKGRSDLEFVAGTRYFVMEFKYQRAGDDPELLLKDAEKQIKTKHYGEQLYPKLKHVHMALVFSGEKRQFVKYAVF